MTAPGNRPGGHPHQVPAGAAGSTAGAAHSAGAGHASAAEAEEAALLGLPPEAPHHTVRYGPHPSQLIDYHLPDGGRQPDLRVTLLHGGFWREAYDRAHLSPLAAALARHGCAVALAEYRRVGGDGGWPATFEDVSRIVATAWPEPELRGGGRGDAPHAGRDGSGRAGRAAAESAPRTGGPAGGRNFRGRHVLLGHSAGGHLALWAAALRTGTAAGAAGAAGGARAGTEDPTPPAHRTTAPASGDPEAAPGRLDPDAAPAVGAPDHVVAVSPVAALGRAHELDLSGGAVAGLLGGPGAVAELLPLTDPLLLPPPAAPVTILHGTADPDVPLALSRAYARVMRRAGARVELRERPGGGHYAALTPGTAAFGELLRVLRDFPPEAVPG
ncbi:hypothetical protein KBZ10_00400 [Streptomyces sp. F63]|uniref:alpha/beta hydrolase n=1 Tax=Streptomyces sp. F63 TaxID=2824887 RepID=UPI001B388371|nr:hypothetical protein [Streptomyces sp. F63]MBQ0983023.1 hypothetical protein [Streptomyces sp. F63]